MLYWQTQLKLTAGTYSPFGASSQISNQTRISCLAKTWLDGGHGNGPNLGLRTGWLIGIDNGIKRRGGGLAGQSNLAS